MMTLWEKLQAGFDRTPAGQPFMVVDGRAFTYGDLADKVARACTVLRAKGVKPGERIGVLSGDPVALSTLMLAALRSGVGFISLPYKLPNNDRWHAIIAARLAHVFIDEAAYTDKDYGDANPVPPDLPCTRLPKWEKQTRGLLDRMFGKPRHPSGYAAELAAADPDGPPSPVRQDATGLLVFTSGTTSRPKIVELSHANLAAQLKIFDEVFDYDASSRILNILPMHFTDGLLHGPLAALNSGACVYRPSEMRIEEIGDLLHGVYRDRITHFVLAPSLLSIIDRLPLEYDDAFSTEDFRYMRSSADLLPEALWRRVQDRFKAPVVNTYGLSETVCEATFCGPREADFKIGTAGRAVGCEVRVINEAGAVPAPGEPGEVEIRGEIVMKGYLAQPELTEQAMNGDWFRTGDLGVLDPDGFLTITGRKKNLIITGGTNVNPVAVAEALVEDERIAEAAVLGLPDPIAREVVAAAIVPAKNASLTASDVISYCRSRLNPAKTPRVVKFFEALPRTASGKVKLGEVQAAMEADLASNSIRADITLEEQVIELAADVLGRRPDELHLTSDARDTFGWDSLAHMNLILAAEQAFDIELSARDVLSITRLEHLKSAVARHLDARESA